jgi:hypothetical protein
MIAQRVNSLAPFRRLQQTLQAGLQARFPHRTVVWNCKKTVRRLSFDYGTFSKNRAHLIYSMCPPGSGL